MTEELTNAANDGPVDPNAPWSYVKFDTSIGSFVIELYHRHTVSTPGVDLMNWLRTFGCALVFPHFLSGSNIYSLRFFVFFFHSVYI